MTDVLPSLSLGQTLPPMMRVWGERTHDSSRLFSSSMISIIVGMIARVDYPLSINNFHYEILRKGTDGKPPL